MAKMFYTLEEAAQQLGMTDEQVQELAASGQLQEFRDRDRLMFKVEQVDLMAHGGDEDLVGGSSMIPLAEDSREGSAIPLASDSGSGIELDSPKEQTGISIFEAEETEEADPSAVTQVTGAVPTELTLESVGSGSGLLDLTQEADDTSLGAAGLLEEIRAGEDSGETAAETLPGEGDVDLFESTSAESDVTPTQAPGVAVAVEPFDGAGSGLVGGMALAMVIILGFGLVVTILGMTGTGGAMLMDKLGEGNMWLMVTGGMAGVLVVFALIGWVMGKRA